MASIIQYNLEQRRYYNSYVYDVKDLTNRELLKEERWEREHIADIDKCEKGQQGNPRKYYLGNDLPSVKKWAIRNHAITVLEIQARGYVWENDKYIKPVFSLKSFNQQLKAHKLELVKGNGYFWFFSDDDTVGLKLASLFTTNVDVCHFKHLSKERWEQELKSILAKLDNPRFL